MIFFNGSVWNFLFLRYESQNWVLVCSALDACSFDVFISASHPRFPLYSAECNKWLSQDSRKPTPWLSPNVTCQRVSHENPNCRRTGTICQVLPTSQDKRHVRTPAGRQTYILIPVLCRVGWTSASLMWVAASIHAAAHLTAAIPQQVVWFGNGQVFSALATQCWFWDCEKVQV